MTKKQTVISAAFISLIIVTLIVINLLFKSLNNPVVEQLEYKDSPKELAPSNKLISKEEITPPETETEITSEDQTLLEQKQIATAMDLLYSNDDEKRREGIELLGDHSTPESEAILTKLLISDANPEIRNIAALTLGSIVTPSKSVINDLIFALGDESGDIGFSALSTLQNYMGSAEKQSEAHKTIIAQLKLKTESNEVTPTMRDAITEILSNQ